MNLFFLEFFDTDVITPLAVTYASHVIWPAAVICPSGVIHCAHRLHAEGGNEYQRSVMTTNNAR